MDIFNPPVSQFIVPANNMGKETAPANLVINDVDSGEHISYRRSAIFDFDFFSVLAVPTGSDNEDEISAEELPSVS
jgi:hypothetical protein